ncbi:hypothetical protein O9992_24060 [Vibrio lentus]|nr:hypothetical protein [Vibrio lentus]
MVAIVAVMVGITIVVSGSFSSGNWIGDALAVFAVICLSMMFTLLRKYQGVKPIGERWLRWLLLAVVMFSSQRHQATALKHG